MKNVFLTICILSLLNCAAQQKKGYATNTNQLKDSTMFDKFNFDLHSNAYAGYEYVADSYYNYGANGFYKLKTGGAFSPNEGKDYYSYYVIPPVPYYFSYYYKYFENGSLQSTGKIGGFKSGIPIGKWKYYDEKGKLTEVDEDKKFGLWDFNKVLDVLDKDGVINLKTGKNREFEKLQFFFDKDKKEWKVKVFKKNISVLVEEYWEYLFDGNTGNYTRDWYERYNKNAEKDMDLPPLKNSKANKKKQ